MCDDKSTKSIKDDDIIINKWIKLQTNYMNFEFVLRFTKLQKLWNIILFNNKNSMKNYIVNLRTKSKKLKRIKTPIEDWILMFILLNNLNNKYKNFVYRMLTQLNNVSNFDKLITFLHEKDRLFKRNIKEIIIIAIIKRYHKK